MKAKEYLMQVERIERIIRNKREEIFRLRNSVESTTAINTGERVMSSGSQDKLGDTITKMVLMQDEISADIEILLIKRREVIATIDQVGDAELIDLLYRRYCLFKSWEQIACEMNYTYRWVTKLNGKALLKVQKILDDREEKRRKNG